MWKRTATRWRHWTGYERRLNGRLWEVEAQALCGSGSLPGRVRGADGNMEGLRVGVSDGGRGLSGRRWLDWRGRGCG